MLVLVEETTKKVVKKGDRFMDFRKEEIYEVTGWKEPQHPGSTGRVYCKKFHKRIDAGDQVEVMENEFYPGVLGLVFMNELEADLSPAKEYWSSEVLYQINEIISGDYNEELKNKLIKMPEDHRKDLADSAFNYIIDNECLWEKINDSIHDTLAKILEDKEVK